MGVAIGHGGLSQADLGLGQLEVSPTFTATATATATGAGGHVACHGALANEIALEFGRGSEYPEYQLAA